MQQLTKHLYAETEYPWANVGAAVTNHGIVLIDSPVRPSQSKHWQNALKPLSPKGIRYVIGTDFHVDHTTGIGFIEGEFTLITAQRVHDELAKVRSNAAASRKHFVDTLKDMGVPDEAEQVANVAVPSPQVCFEDKLTLHLEPLTFEIYRKGGHTPACTCVLVPEEGTLFSSDVMINEAGAGMRDCNMKDWIAALAWMETLPIDRVVPGHGEVCTIKEVRQSREQFSEIMDLMRDCVRAGQGKEESAAAPRFEKFFWADTTRGPSWVEARRWTFRKGLEKLYEEASAEAGR